MSVFLDKKTGRYFVQFDYQRETYKFRLPAETTKSKADQFETKKKSELFFESHGIGERKETFYEIFLTDVFLPHVEQNQSGSSFYQAVLICKTSLQFFAGKSLRSIKPADIERFKTYRANLLTQHDTPRKPATVHREISIISRIFSMAVRNDLCEYNPCSRVEMPKFDNIQNKILLQKDEAAFFASFDPFQGELAKDISKLVLNTGLRQNDALGLTKFEVDLNAGLIRLVQGKTRRRVEIPMNETVNEIISRRYQSAAGLLFPSPKTGERIKSVKTAIKNACVRAEIPVLSIRDLRRTFGTRLHEKGFDDSTVGQLLGHSDMRSIHRYKRGKEIKREAVLSLENNVLKAVKPAKFPLVPKKKRASNE